MFITGGVLSGEKLIDNLAFKQKLLKAFPEAIGGEMEGAGIFASAARAGIEWILVKGVCDWADGKKHNGYQEMAAAAASSLTHFVLNDKNVLDGVLSRSEGKLRHRVQRPSDEALPPSGISRGERKVPVIKRPRVFYVYDSEYQALVKSEIAMMRRAFPKVIPRKFIKRSGVHFEALLKKVTTGDIVHLLLRLDNQGQLWVNGTPFTVLRLNDLISQNAPSLMVFVHCEYMNSLSQLKEHTNIVSADARFSPDNWVNWARIFYGGLASGVSLNEAHRSASSNFEERVDLILNKDITYKFARRSS